ncbi:hypothetical protein A2U01_0065412, partial [Trifolium medium]|nr:hypothetical protein [Trifolium medium]
SAIICFLESTPAWTDVPTPAATFVPSNNLCSITNTPFLLQGTSVLLRISGCCLMTDRHTL